MTGFAYYRSFSLAAELGNTQANGRGPRSGVISTMLTHALDPEGSIGIQEGFSETRPIASRDANLSLTTYYADAAEGTPRAS